ncbi:hypothetical protein M896_091470 [Ordospora colligata OC4]|uniref:Uncharacterized protein n=1 Tax=Ordospora colligata OC4 TaxID=1354746 RepID=A0A0B2UJ21_9MICR|nr:uncharacterized protein M896_091470 [Ordospora colligata OC4]KHN69219.1 hypothetical protein M896_091470 [Ordospora colligata OC4]TBU14497.1 hypothetical protein CWI40_091430 [Ordospora colligata]TBU14674.1 hypothetical protein CWI41_091460 [Ordospora colligata]
MLFLYFMLAYAQMDELGYLYSVGRNRFITVKQDKNHKSFIMGTHKNENPSPIKISKETKNGRGGIIMYANDKDAEKYKLSDKVGDLALDSTNTLHFYSKHMKWNQLAKFVLQPGNHIKIMFGDDRCLFMAKDYTLKGERCKNDGRDKFQLFAWFPKKYFRMSKLHKILRYNKFNNNSGYDDDDKSSSYSVYDSDSRYRNDGRRDPNDRHNSNRGDGNDSDSGFDDDSRYRNDPNDREPCDKTSLLLLGMGSGDDDDRKKSKYYNSFKHSSNETKSRKSIDDDSAGISKKMHNKNPVRSNEIYPKQKYKKCSRQSKGIRAPNTNSLDLKRTSSSICSIEKMLFQPFNRDICDTIEGLSNISKSNRYAYRNTDSDSSESDCNNDVDNLWNDIQNIKVKSGIKNIAI